MEHVLRDRLVDLTNVNAAIVADALWNKLNRDSSYDLTIKRNDKTWVRASAFSMMSDISFLSRKQIQRCLRLLKEQRIVKREQFLKGEYDHAYWYSFTTLGIQIMKGERSTCQEKGHCCKCG